MQGMVSTLVIMISQNYFDTYFTKESKSLPRSLFLHAAMLLNWRPHKMQHSMSSMAALSNAT